MNLQSKNILITGASTGIGYALVKVYLNHGYKVFGSVRKEKDAKRLAEEMGADFTPLLFDVTDGEAISVVADSLEQTIGSEGLAGLINNAGIALGGPFIDLEVEDFRYQFDVNILGMIRVTQAFLPLLGARENHCAKPGKIVQISSISGRIGMPFVSPYAGSKHAMEGITECFRKELMLYGIDVLLIEPGPIKTPIWEKSMNPLLDKFKNSVYQPMMKKSEEKFMRPSLAHALSAEEAGKIIFKEFEKKRPGTRKVIVAQRFKNWILPHLLPARLLDRILGKALGLTK